MANDYPPPAPRPVKKPPRAGWIGPLFQWELIRLARRGQDTRARFILASTLFIVLATCTILYFQPSDPLALFTGTSQQVSLAESARFGDVFATTFLVTQLVVLMLLTPAYAAAGIAEEKERRTLEYVLTSDLTSREIVLGKFVGRLVFLLGVLFAGLPILSLTQLYGGVSLDFLLTSYLFTASTVTMLAAIAAAAATAVPTYRAALFRAYALTAIYLFTGCGCWISSPVSIVLTLGSLAGTASVWWLAGGFALVHFILAGVAVRFAVRRIRRMRAIPGAPRRPPRRLRPELTPILDAESATESVPLQTAKRLKPRPVSVSRPRPEPPPTRYPVPPAVRERPPIGSRDPFYWKEQFTTGRRLSSDDDSIRGILLGLSASASVVMVCIVMLGIMSAMLGSAPSNTGTAWFVLLPATGSLFLFLAQVGSAAAGAVVRERQRQTLESLLTIPVPRRRILAPKWQASASRGAIWGVLAMVALPVGLLLTSVQTLALVMIFFTPVAAAAVTSAGLALSVRAHTPGWATLWVFVLVGLVCVAPLGVWMVADSVGVLGGWVGAAMLIVGLAALAWFAWCLAVRDFERLGRA